MQHCLQRSSHELRMVWGLACAGALRSMLPGRGMERASMHWPQIVDPARGCAETDTLNRWPCRALPEPCSLLPSPAVWLL